MTIHVLETQQTHQNSETKTKTKATNLRLNRSNSCEKKIKSDQPIKPIWNQTHQIHMKPKSNQTDLPSKRKSNPSPISTSPSTTDFPYQTHQTHCRSTHPPPLSSGYFNFSFMCVPVPNYHSFQFQGVLSWVGNEWNWERGWNGFMEGRVHQMEPDLRRCRIGLSSSTRHRRRTDVGLPRGFL